MSDILEAAAEYLYGDDGVLTQLKDEAGQSADVALSYLKGRFDQADLNPFEDNGVPGFPNIPVRSTPLFFLMRKINEPEIEMFERARKQGVRGVQVYEDLLLQILDLEKDGNVLMPQDDYLDVLYPDREPGSVVTVEQAKDDALSERSKYEDQSNIDPLHSTQVDTENMIAGLQAASPLLVAASGFKPSITRQLMGAHLVADALSGVLNFRSPGRSADFGFVDIISPYLAMGSIALTSQVTGEL